MKQSKLFSDFYKIDESTDLYMIEVGLDQYADIFSEWDPAPFKRRGIDPDLELYLEGSSDEIPFRYPIEICFIVPARIRDQRLEAETVHGLKNSFTFKLYLLKKELRKTNVKELRFVLLGLILLGIAAVFANRVAENVVFSTLVDGVLITGWVLIWEAASLFFFTNRELYHRDRTYKRLQNAPIIFREAEVRKDELVNS
jgi:hypothetical protein